MQKYAIPFRCHAPRCRHRHGTRVADHHVFARRIEVLNEGEGDAGAGHRDATSPQRGAYSRADALKRSGISFVGRTRAAPLALAGLSAFSSSWRNGAMTSIGIGKA